MSASLAVDYFAVFGLPPVFAQDPAEPERRYLDLQRSAHPDRYAHLNATERRAAVEAVPGPGRSAAQARRDLLSLTQDSQPVLTLQMNRAQDVRLRWVPRAA